MTPAAQGPPAQGPLTETARLEAFSKRIRRVRARSAAGLPSWWRHRAYTSPARADETPKWHLFLERIPPEDLLPGSTAEWRAPCGYRRAFDEELVYALPLVRDSIATPALRCAKCSAKLARDTAAPPTGDSTDASSALPEDPNYDPDHPGFA